MIRPLKSFGYGIGTPIEFHENTENALFVLEKCQSTASMFTTLLFNVASNTPWAN